MYADPYSNLGEKYRFLLQWPEGTRVMLSGPYWSDLSSDLARGGLEPRSERLGSDDGGDAVGVMADVTRRELHRVRNLIASNPSFRGGVLLIREGRFRWNRSTALPAAVETPGLASREFVAVPSIESVEAFVSPPPAWGDWESRPGLRGRIASLIRREPHDRLAFLFRAGQATGFTEVARLMALVGEPGPWVVERYHLRRRGAMVFVLRDPGGDRRLLRVATNTVVAELVRRNHKVVDWLTGHSVLPTLVRELVPAPAGTCRDGDVEVFAEEFRPGRLAWTLYRAGPVQATIDAGLFRFTHALQSATRAPVRTGESDGTVTDRLLDPIGEYFPSDGRAGAALRTIRGCIARSSGGGAFRCLSHGDFGTGNALAVEDGRLTAIIDWDQSIERDLPGIDWCDYLLKARPHGTTLLTSLHEMVESSWRAGCLAPAHGGFGPQDFQLSPWDMRLIPCLAALRDISRSARFPAEMQAGSAHRTTLLEGIATILAGTSP